MALSTKQKILLDLMARSDRIMKEHDIDYFLFGGSTLGALRHDGFIPWDDDIDIIMDAENYYRLEKVFAGGPIDDIDLVFFHNDSNWYRSFAMLVNLEDTCYTHPVLFSDGLATGTRIDVMICDYVPSHRLGEYRHDLMIYEEILTDSMVVDIDVHKVRDEYLEMREKLEKVGKRTLEKELREGLESYATSDDDELVVRFWTKELRHYPKDQIYPPVYHKFEEHEFPIPAKPQEQMRLQFGNDWYIIPEQDQYLLHSFVDNYYISGNNYHEDIRKFIDRAEGEKVVRKRKELILRRADYTRDNLSFRKELTFNRELMRSGIRSDEKPYLEMIEEEDYGSLYGSLRDLLKVTGSAASVSKEHKSIPTEIMKAWIESCIYCGKYFDAAKIMSAYEIEDDEEFRSERDILQRVIALADAYQDRDREGMNKWLGTFSEVQRQRIPDCILARAAVEGIEGEGAEEILRLCDKYLGFIENNWDIMKLKADILYANGEVDEAMPLYEIVHEKTVNGLDLNDIEKRFDFTPRFDRSETDPFETMIGN